MRTVETYNATIYVGSKERDTGTIHTVQEARELLQSYVDKVGLCVTLTPTEYIYTNGSEDGFIVGLINYPRFPSTPEQLENHTLTISELLLQKFNQYKVSIVFKDKTIMLEKTQETL